MKEINPITGEITESRTGLGIPGAMSLLAREGEVITTVLDLEGVALVRGMGPHVPEAIHGGRVRRTVMKVMVLEGTVKVRGRNIQGHISPWRDRHMPHFG